jgi:ribosome-associated protein
VTREPHLQDDGSLFIRSRLTIPGDEIELRVTTSGGPGGQHANRSLTRVVATFHVGASEVLSDAERSLLQERYGSAVRSNASRFRSQSQNRKAALDQLARRIGDAVILQAPRRATRPTRASKVRRVDEKKARGRVKQQRRQRDDD